MEKSGSIKEIAAALLKFHSCIGAISKDAKNPFYGNKYATLHKIQEAIRQPLQDAGLVVVQMPDGDNGLTTILTHAESGEYFQSTNHMHPEKTSPQGVGSAITYSRRYGLSAVLGLSIDEDDDGNAASQPDSNKTQVRDTQNTKELPWLNTNDPKWNDIVNHLKGSGTMKDVRQKYKVSKETEAKLLQQIV